MYQVRKEDGAYAVYNSRGKLQSIHSDEDDAESAVNRYVEDDQWNAANRD